MQPNMELSEVSSIIVDVSPPPSAKTCFIAGPFSDEFEPVLNQIIIAASGLKLQPVCTKHIQQAVDFVTDFKDGIRSACVVVAVLSPEKATSKPNPNVLYELGFAHAIGKPIVMLTTDPGNVPSDLEKQYLQKYDPDLNLVGTIQNAITRKIEHMVTPLTDPQVENVTVTDWKHRPLLDPEFWDSFGKILSFAKRIQENVLHIERAASSLSGRIVGVLTTEGSRRLAFRQLFDWWSNYYQDFCTNDFVPNVAARLYADFKEVDDCYQQLAVSAGASVDVKEAINTSRGFYEKMKLTLEELQPLHDEIARIIGSAVAHLDSDTRTTEDLDEANSKSVKLYSDATNCSTQARQLIFNFIGMLY